MIAAAEPGQFSFHRRKNKRTRLYPRGLKVLQALAAPGARLIWNEEEGRYRLNGIQTRKATVQPRTRQMLFKLDAVRADPETWDLHITSRGKQILRKREAITSQPTDEQAHRYERSLSPPYAVHQSQECRA